MAALARHTIFVGLFRLTEFRETESVDLLQRDDPGSSPSRLTHVLICRKPFYLKRSRCRCRGFVPAAWNKSGQSSRQPCFPGAEPPRVVAQRPTFRTVRALCRSCLRRATYPPSKVKIGHFRIHRQASRIGPPRGRRNGDFYFSGRMAPPDRPGKCPALAAGGRILVRWGIGHVQNSSRHRTTWAAPGRRVEGWA